MFWHGLIQIDGTSNYFDPRLYQWCLTVNLADCMFNVFVFNVSTILYIITDMHLAVSAIFAKFEFHSIMFGICIIQSYDGHRFELISCEHFLLMSMQWQWEHGFAKQLCSKNDIHSMFMYGKVILGGVYCFL